MTSLVTSCPDCRAEIAPGLLACPWCARLTHGAELASLAASASEAEARGDLSAALAAWRRATELLPPGTTQLASIQARMKALSAAVDGRATPPPGVGSAGVGKGAGRFAGLGAVGVALLKAKTIVLAVLGNGKLLLLGLTKAPTLLSMLLYASLRSGRATGLGLGIVACIYVHEIGHVAALRRYGIAASAPMFVPGFGALVRLKQYPTDAHEEARTGLAGPLWGLAATLGAAAIGALAHSPTAFGVAAVSAQINLFNLIPVWRLDGARGLKALSKEERLAVAAVGMVTALVLREPMPAIVGGLVLVRALHGGNHETGDRRMAALFVALLLALSALATLPLDSVLTR